jgi:hypothetical protein
LISLSFFAFNLSATYRSKPYITMAKQIYPIHKIIAVKKWNKLYNDNLKFFCLRLCLEYQKKIEIVREKTRSGIDRNFRTNITLYDNI